LFFLWSTDETLSRLSDTVEQLNSVLNFSSYLAQSPIEQFSLGFNFVSCI
jgi:hypothetical protein